MLMFNEKGGFCNFPEGSAPAGWVPGQAIWDAAMEAKNPAPIKVEAPVAKVPEPVTLSVQPVKRAPGRPRNVVPSILNNGEI